MLAVKFKLISKFLLSNHLRNSQKGFSSFSLKMTSNCVFCDICSGEQPTEFLYEDNEIVIFKDIKPAARYHYLAVPKMHIKDIKSLTIDHKPLLEKLLSVGKRVLQDKNGDINDLQLGFHVPPFNSISHLHLHFISPASEMTFFGRLIFKPNTWWFASADSVMNNLPQANKL